MANDTRPVTVTLSNDEALVLDALLATLENQGPLRITHPAELRALWNLHASLERVLVAPFKPDYDRLLASARERLTDSAGEAQ
jgi:hypothetical protein